MAFVGCREEIYYSADSITAWVVDADTKQPLAGVNVLAEWTAYGGGLEGGNLTGHAMVMEAVSDENGKFILPGWGPKRRHFSGLIRTDAPLLILFKSGYRAQGWNNVGQIGHAPNHMQSEWNGKVLELRRFEGSVDEYEQALSLYLGNHIGSLLDNDECNWKGMPRFLAALDVQNQQFLEHRTRFALRSLPSLSDTYSRKCGSLERYVRDNSK